MQKQKSHNNYIFKRKTINPTSTSLLFLLTVRHICRTTMSQCTERGREEGRENRQTEIKTDEKTRSQQKNSQQETHAMSRTRIKKQTKKKEKRKRAPWEGTIVFCAQQSASGRLPLAAVAYHITATTQLYCCRADSLHEHGYSCHPR